MAKDFDFTKQFVRESDGESGYVVFRSDIGRIVIVRFPRIGVEMAYMMSGVPFWVHNHEHRLINI